MTREQPDLDRLLVVREVAERLRCREETVRLYIQRGLLPARVMPNGAYRIAAADLEQFLVPAESKER